jgi:hypothetical protein
LLFTTMSSAPTNRKESSSAAAAAPNKNETAAEASDPANKNSKGNYSPRTQYTRQCLKTRWAEISNPPRTHNTQRRRPEQTIHRGNTWHQRRSKMDSGWLDPETVRIMVQKGRITTTELLSQRFLDNNGLVAMLLQEEPHGDPNHPNYDRHFVHNPEEKITAFSIGSVQRALTREGKQIVKLRLETRKENGGDLPRTGTGYTASFFKKKLDEFKERRLWIPEARHDDRLQLGGTVDDEWRNDLFWLGDKKNRKPGSKPPRLYFSVTEALDWFDGGLPTVGGNVSDHFLKERHTVMAKQHIGPEAKLTIALKVGGKHRDLEQDRFLVKIFVRKTGETLHLYAADPAGKHDDNPAKIADMKPAAKTNEESSDEEFDEDVVDYKSPHSARGTSAPRDDAPTTAPKALRRGWGTPSGGVGRQLFSSHTPIQLNPADLAAMRPQDRAAVFAFDQATSLARANQEHTNEQLARADAQLARTRQQADRVLGLAEGLYQVFQSPGPGGRKRQADQMDMEDDDTASSVEETPRKKSRRGRK